MPRRPRPHTTAAVEGIVLLQRAFTLIVLLVGAGLGLLVPRPWAEVPEGEAAKKGGRLLLANVRGNGALTNGSKGASATRTAPGKYTVTSPHDVSACAPAAMAGATTTGAWQTLGIGSEIVSTFHAGEVRLQFNYPDGTDVDTDFPLVVVC